MHTNYASTLLQHKARLLARRLDPDMSTALSVSTAKRPSHNSSLSAGPRGGKANSKIGKNTTLGIGRLLSVTATNSVTAICGIVTQTKVQTKEAQSCWYSPTYRHQTNIQPCTNVRLTRPTTSTRQCRVANIGRTTNSHQHQQATGQFTSRGRTIDPQLPQGK